MMHFSVKAIKVSESGDKELLPRKHPLSHGKVLAVPPKKMAISNNDATPSFPEPDYDDDSSDGVPDLEFPTDLPLPEPDSPPGDFTLDPSTGKVPGKEYPRTPTPPPTPPPLPEPLEKEEPISNSTTLDTLVKQATEGLTESDLAGNTVENSSITTKVEIEDEDDDDDEPVIVSSSVPGM